MIADVDYSERSGTMVCAYVADDGDRSAVWLPAFKTTILGEYVAIIHALERRPDIQTIRCDCIGVVNRLNDPKRYGCPVHRYCKRLLGNRTVKYRSRKGNPAHALCRKHINKPTSLDEWVQWIKFAEKGMKFNGRRQGTDIAGVRPS